MSNKSSFEIENFWENSLTTEMLPVQNILPSYIIDERCYFVATWYSTGLFAGANETATSVW